MSIQFFYFHDKQYIQYLRLLLFLINSTPSSNIVELLIFSAKIYKIL